MDKIKRIRSIHIALCIFPLFFIGGILSIGPIYIFKAKHIADTFLDNTIGMNCTVLDTSIVHSTKVNHVQLDDMHIISSSEDSYAAIKFMYQLLVNNITTNFTNVDLLYKKDDEISGIFELVLDEHYYEGSVHDCYMRYLTNEVFMFVPDYKRLEQFETGFTLVLGMTAIGITACFSWILAYKECVWGVMLSEDW